MPLDHQICPFLVLRVLANDFTKSLHPGILVGRGIGIEIDSLAVSKSHPETFLHEHVSFLFLGKG